jgi:hypothetical protein
MWRTQDFREEIKQGVVVTASKISNRTKLSVVLINKLHEIATRYGFRLTREELGTVALPNSMSSVTCYSWLLMHFRSCGDEEPNVDEIHLDPTDEKVIFTEYCEDMRFYRNDDDTLSYSQFCEVSCSVLLNLVLK